MPETSYLFATTGDGPAECEIALKGILKATAKEACQASLLIDIDQFQTRDGVKSAFITVSGAGAANFARTWTGTVLWQCQSPVRPNHRRKNWFVGFFPIDLTNEPLNRPKDEELKFETFRSGGPGGQHQNTTDSGVRVKWKGLTASSRSERSQHRNKSVAVERLYALIASLENDAKSETAFETHALHKSLERGSPIRSYTGRSFQAV